MKLSMFTLIQPRESLEILRKQEKQKKAGLICDGV